LDPRNGITSGGVTFAYSFACDTNFNYEYAAKLEGDHQQWQMMEGIGQLLVLVLRLLILIVFMKLAQEKLIYIKDSSKAI
jgi:hypothetical protein